MQKHGSKPWFHHFVCTETSPHPAHATKTVCTQRERDNSWSITTYNKIIIIIAWLWVSLLAPILYICCSWNMSRHPELTLLQTALNKQLIFLNLWAAPLFSLQDTAHNFAAAIYLWLHREVGSRLPSLLLLFLLLCFSSWCRSLSGPHTLSYEVTQPQSIPTTLYSPL